LDESILKSNLTGNLTFGRARSRDLDFSPPPLKSSSCVKLPGADRNARIRTNKLRVVAVDDNAAFLTEFTRLLGTEFDVVDTAADGESALECIRRARPDVVVLDLEMPGLNGIQVARELAADSRRPAVVMCSVEDDPEIIEAARLAGALGYVVKSRIHEDLIASVQSAARGESFISPI
jgi:DNA-binding NarL/FixJ family response regulator